MRNTTVPVASITDTSRGVYKVTGRCSMADPCRGESCPEHGGVITKDITAGADWSVSVSGPLPQYDGFDGKRFTPAMVVWQHRYHHGADYGIGVSLYNAAVTTSAMFTPEAVPTWVPRPPEGWDAGVAAVIASLAAS